MELFIDTTDREKIVLELRDGRQTIAKIQKSLEKLSERLLPEIGQFLKARRVRLSDLEMILVNPGPGGFSATRTGVATANALNFALGIDKVVLPKYGKLPNITKARLR